MTEDDRLKRLEDAVEALQKHVKWLLELRVRTADPKAKADVPSAQHR